MFSEILARTYYGNTVLQWLIALAIIVASVLVAKAVYWVFGNVVRRLTQRTKTRLDNILVDTIEEPVVMALAVFGIWYGLGTLTLPEGPGSWIDKVLQVVIVLSIGWLVVRLLDALVREYVAPLASKSGTDLDDQLMPILRKGTKLVVWAMTIIIALNNAGYDVAALLAGLGIGGLALAMAAKDTVSNVFGGFTIFTDQPFVLNERVRVSGYDGMIREIGVRSTRLETLDGTIVTMPNSRFSDTPVENVSREPSRKVLVKLGLTYDTTPDQMERAIGILKEIVAANSGLEEKVIAGFTEFGDFSMNLLFIYYIKKEADIVGAQTEVNMEILRRFTQAGLEFAFPTQTLYTKSA
jgi:MscS family membrane protein